MELGFLPNTVLYSNDKNSVVVRLATHPSTAETVVLKELTTSNRMKARRYLDETWAHSTLHHPSICKFKGTFYTHNEKDGKYKCTIVMERQAVDLEKLIRHKKTPFREEDLRRWIVQTVDALAYAQKAKMCHRDIKPKNLLLTDDAQIKIVDFGFSKFVSEVDGRQTWVGTIAYLSPKLLEQYDIWRKYGRSSEKVMHNPYKSDVYSLGVSMLHTALRYLPNEGPAGHARLVDTLIEYSPELKRVLREMLVRNEDQRKDFLALKPFIAKLFQALPATPPISRTGTAAVESINSSALGLSMDSEEEVSHVPSLVVAPPSSSCACCSTPLTNSANRISLPCGGSHSVCSIDCLARAVSNDGFKHMKCLKCGSLVPEKFLNQIFRVYATSKCSQCGGKVKSKYRVAKCHHLLCKVHFQMNSHVCSICGVPYDFNRLQNLSSRLRRLISTITFSF